ncbi:conserved hypothetical protein [Ricinus communis]|uniref:Uncharacterized protein n=1 Tax=Ricinus communis TaxID=3988 RepID=B9SA50_RICCO|nr:conserved hypothetical protein [Ricinus communis]
METTKATSIWHHSVKCRSRRRRRRRSAQSLTCSFLVLKRSVSSPVETSDSFLIYVRFKVVHKHKSHMSAGTEIHSYENVRLVLER